MAKKVWIAGSDYEKFCNLDRGNFFIRRITWQTRLCRKGDKLILHSADCIALEGIPVRVKDRGTRWMALEVIA